MHKGEKPSTNNHNQARRRSDGVGRSTRGSWPRAGSSLPARASDRSGGPAARLPSARLPSAQLPETGQLAGGTGAKDVQAVVVRREAVGTSQPGQVLLHGVLELRRGGYVDDPPAARAEQVVVVVLGQVLGQLEAGELVVGAHAPDNPGLLQVHQVTVGGAAGQLGRQRGDVADA